MAGSLSVRSWALLFGAMFLSELMQLAHGGSEVAAASSSSSSFRIDGRAVDQGVAYVLMLIALLVTYMFH